jgi:quercetin dioxygenase-like cupin family protein
MFIKGRSALLAMGVVGLVASAPVAAAEDPATISLGQFSAAKDGLPYPPYGKGQPRISVEKIIIPANTTLPYHCHAVINVAYVLSGNLIMTDKSTGKSYPVNAGQVLPELVGKWHNGKSGSEPVELLVFYAGTVGGPPLTVKEGDKGAQSVCSSATKS